MPEEFKITDQERKLIMFIRTMKEHEKIEVKTSEKDFKKRIVTRTEMNRFSLDFT